MLTLKRLVFASAASFPTVTIWTNAVFDWYMFYQMCSYCSYSLSPTKSCWWQSHLPITNWIINCTVQWNLFYYRKFTLQSDVIIKWTYYKVRIHGVTQVNEKTGKEALFAEDKDVCFSIFWKENNLRAVSKVFHMNIILVILSLFVL